MKPHAFKSGRSGLLLASGWLTLMFIISLLAPLIANDKPLYVRAGEHHFFPAFTGQEWYSQNIRFRELRNVKSDSLYIMMPLIPFAQGISDPVNANFRSPSDEQFNIINGKQKNLHGLERHLLGTGQRGEDVFSGLIHGTRTTLITAILAALLAGIIGISIGAATGYLGDDGSMINRGTLLAGLIGLIPAWFYSFTTRQHNLSASFEISTLHGILQLFISMIIFLILMLFFLFVGNTISRWKWMKKKIQIPFDKIISRITEITDALPKLIVIISIAAICRPSIINVILLIGFTHWTTLARITRGELLRIREHGYISAAKAAGYGNLRIIFKHALPNALPVISVTFVSAIAAAIMTESSLSFIGIGMPQNTSSWGSLLAGAREEFRAWWLVVFPGILLFLTITSLNIIADSISNRSSKS